MERGTTHHSIFYTSLWLLVLMILMMIVIGGVTRLTGSGLSIVEWAPIKGILPPMSPAEWAEEFARYQSSPEFMKVNFDMTLEGFKGIFWLEYIHRLWGRLLGFVLLIPTVVAFFNPAYKKYLPTIGILWVLGLGQGLLGWLMVKSGLQQDPQVSPYRLAAHLLMGVTLLGMTFWLALKTSNHHLYIHRRGISMRLLKRCRFLNMLLISLLLVTIFYGALVAGNHAGLIYNMFPLMGDGLVPFELFHTSPWWNDILQNPVSIQFVHRTLATVLFVGTFAYGLYLLRSPVPYVLRVASGVVLGCVCLQFILGIVTLLYSVPVALGALHQAGALLLFLSLLWALFLIRTTLKQ